MISLAFSSDIFYPAYIFSAFFGVICIICKTSQNYTDLRCLLDIKVFTEQANGAGALPAYCSGESSVS